MAALPGRAGNQLDSLGIMINVIVLWQTAYIQAALDHLAAKGYPINPANVVRLTPLGHPTTNLARSLPHHQPPTRHRTPPATNQLTQDPARILVTGPWVIAGPAPHGANLAVTLHIRKEVAAVDPAEAAASVPAHASGIARRRGYLVVSAHDIDEDVGAVQAVEVRSDVPERKVNGGDDYREQSCIKRCDSAGAADRHRAAVNNDVVAGAGVGVCGHVGHAAAADTPSLTEGGTFTPA